MMADYEQYRDLATERELEYIDAIKEYGGQRQAAKALNVNRSSIFRALRSLRKRAQKKRNEAPATVNHTVPDHLFIKGTSTYFDKDGNYRGQWVKTATDSEKLETLTRYVVETLAEQVEGKKPPAPIPEHSIDDLLSVYPMGDPHIGMYAWAQEAGEDFDCDIAERDLQQAIGYLVDKAPDSTHALIVNLGDFYHSDTLENITRRSGHTLDVDGRWSRVLMVGISAMVYCIDKALEKHQRVTVINEIGNHDDQTSYVLSVVLSAYYRNEPRVDINMSPMPFHYYRFGQVLIGVTHGHNTKHETLGPIMATDRAQEWGETKHRYWYVGHIHHRKAQELHGCMVEAFRTLAAKDAWHASKGYRSGRDMMCIVHHKDHGEVARHRFDISMIKGA